MYKSTVIPRVHNVLLVILSTIIGMNAVSYHQLAIHVCRDVIYQSFLDQTLISSPFGYDHQLTTCACILGLALFLTAGLFLQAVFTRAHNTRRLTWLITFVCLLGRRRPAFAGSRPVGSHKIPLRRHSRQSSLVPAATVYSVRNEDDITTFQASVGSRTNDK